MFGRMLAKNREVAEAMALRVQSDIATPGGAIRVHSVPPLLGDVTGRIIETIVAGFRGRPLSEAVPTHGDVYTWDAADQQWQPKRGATSTRWEPVVTGGPGNEQIVFSNGDIVMTEVPI
jgi:hypothetical protein